MGRQIAKLDAFAHNYAGDYAEAGAKVAMPVIAATAGIFNKDTNNYEQSSTVGTAEISLNKHLVAGFNVSPKQMSDGLGAYAGLMEQFGDNAGRALARAVEDAVVGLVEPSEDPTDDVELPLTKAGFCGLYADCFAANLNPADCVVVLNPTAYAKMLEVVGADIVNLEKVIETGKVDNFLGFRRILCSASVDSGLLGFIAEYGAIGVAGRRIPLLEGYPLYEEFIDSDTGIPATLIGFQKWATGDYYVTATALFGADIVRAAGVVRLVAESEDSNDGAETDDSNG
jgi:hypothetical protein